MIETFRPHVDQDCDNWEGCCYSCTMRREAREARERNEAARDKGFWPFASREAKELFDRTGRAS